VSGQPAGAGLRFPQARLLVFAKSPRPGRVKTRLVPALGRRGAAALYRRMVRTTLERFSTAALCPLELWCAPQPSHGFFHACRRDYGVSLHRQQGRDLGERMHRALAASLKDASFSLLIGGDCPSLTVEDLRQAMDALDQGVDVVLGPAEDGGYVLIGMRHAHWELFHGLPWGGDRVAAMTRSRMRSLGLRWRELPLRWDVDRPADLDRLLKFYSGGAPRR